MLLVYNLDSLLKAETDPKFTILIMGSLEISLINLLRQKGKWVHLNSRRYVKCTLSNPE